MAKFTVLVTILTFFAARSESKELPSNVVDNQRFAPSCSININTQLPRPQPLLLIPGTEEFRYPATSNRQLQLNPGETVELVCSNGFNLAPSKNSIIVSCVIDTIFNYDSTMHQFSDFSCRQIWYSSARRTYEPCENNSSIIQIGFDLGTRFPKIMDICHNEETFENHWIKHEMYAAHAGYQSSNPRPNWYQGDFYHGIDTNYLYTVNKQRQTIAQILQSQELADDIVRDVNSGIYMARGHIAARVDFIYGTQQNATFWFLVVAPQWQNFNDGNWLPIEEQVRVFIAARNLNVTVYGGTYGAHLQTDVNGDQQPIFLDYDPNGVQRLPAPKIYYKILIDERNRAGIALVGVNDIHITSMEQIDEHYMFCEDIGDKVSWINWERRNFKKGFAYACEVNPFLKRIGHLAHLDVPNLLI